MSLINIILLIVFFAFLITSIKSAPKLWYRDPAFWWRLLVAVALLMIVASALLARFLH